MDDLRHQINVYAKTNNFLILSVSMSDPEFYEAIVLSERLPRSSY